MAQEMVQSLGHDQATLGAGLSRTGAYVAPYGRMGRGAARQARLQALADAEAVALSVAGTFNEMARAGAMAVVRGIQALRNKEELQ